MLVSRIVTLIVEGYDDLPGWYLAVLGWGTIVVHVVAAIVFTTLRWKRDPGRLHRLARTVHDRATKEVRS